MIHNQNTALLQQSHYPHSNSRGPQGEALRQIHALLMRSFALWPCVYHSWCVCVFVRANLSFLDKAKQQLHFCCRTSVQQFIFYTVGNTHFAYEQILSNNRITLFPKPHTTQIKRSTRKISRKSATRKEQRAPKACWYLYCTEFSKKVVHLYISQYTNHGHGSVKTGEGTTNRAASIKAI